MRDLNGLSRFVQREVMILALLIALAVGIFSLTHAVAARDQRLNVQDAAALYTQGMQRLQEGHVADAVSALRLATTKDRGNRTYVPALARALAAAGRTDDARQVLLLLRESMPEDPEINLELARVAVKRLDLSEAVRYYHSALYGVWSTTDPMARARLHVELIQFLLQQGRTSDALAELVALGTNLPDTVPAHLEIGQLLLAAGDPQRARDQFARALALDPRSQPALAGTGQAAFELGEYANARRLLSELSSPSPAAARQRDVAALVLTTDPLMPGVTLAERRRRIVTVLAQALRRVDACEAQPAGQTAEMRARLETARIEAQSIQPKLTLRSLRDFPETIDRAIESSVRAEQTTRDCGEPTPLDDAIALIGRRRGAAPS